MHLANFFLFFYYQHVFNRSVVVVIVKVINKWLVYLSAALMDFRKRYKSHFFIQWTAQSMTVSIVCLDYGQYYFISVSLHKNFKGS